MHYRSELVNRTKELEVSNFIVSKYVVSRALRLITGNAVMGMGMPL